MQKLLTIANTLGDGTNYRLVVTPDAPCTMYDGYHMDISTNHKEVL